MINTIFDIVVHLSCSNMLIRNEYHDFSCPVFACNTLGEKREYCQSEGYGGPLQRACDVTLFDSKEGKTQRYCLILITLAFMVILEDLGCGIV